jgi:CRISPR system Cascade subunit CasA
VIGRGAAAIALYALQSFAPSGGAGHRVSLRGGGPLTTLPLPPGPSDNRPPTLWHALWASVLWDTGWGDPVAAMDKMLPWLAPTRVSSGKQVTTPADVHPAQAFWGMPRRIRLDFAPAPQGAFCDLTGEPDAVLVPSYRTRPHGNAYSGWSRAHPLSPYYRQKPADPEWLPVHPQPGKLGYRNWVAFVISDNADAGRATRAPARIIAEARSRFRDLRIAEQLRLIAFGFDMDNMKARGFVEEEMPLLFLSEEAQELARAFVRAAQLVESSLSYNVGFALWGRELPANDKGDRRLARDRFWQRTEVDFFALVRDLDQRLAREEGETDPVARQWLSLLQRQAFAIFDELVPLDAIEEGDIERLVKARRGLSATLFGRGPAGSALYGALGLPLPETAAKKGGRAA